MTTAGLAALVTARSELYEMRYLPDRNQRLDEQIDRAINDGICWLGHYFTVTGNPRGSGWHYYYLYGLERAGVLSCVVYMGTHRWYAEGARHLVDTQGPDGGWQSRMGPRRGRGPVAAGVVTSDQCFALLFLARATARALGVVTEQPLIDLTGGTDLPDRDAKNLFLAAMKELAGLSGKDLRLFVRSCASEVGLRVVDMNDDETRAWIQRNASRVGLRVEECSEDPEGAVDSEDRAVQPLSETSGVPRSRLN